MKMRLSKFLSVTTVATLCCLLYVYQQTEVFRLAYVGQKKEVSFLDLLDKNTFLRYNIEKNASLIRIGNKVFQARDYQMPDTYRLVRLAQPLENLKLARNKYKKENLFSRLFGIKRQAEARTINP
jgi:hypothetical protein